jgi:hypothetical protein
MTQVLDTQRDVEPLEYLAHQDHSFLFAPGAERASYSTNGFSLVGLALAGVLNLTDWADLDQRELVWGKQLFPDDQTLFGLRGVCAKDPRIGHQYTTPGPYKPFVDITNHSCLNSWLGGNVAPRPLDVARFMQKVFTGELLTQDSVKKMTSFHPLTDGFGMGSMSYGLGTIGSVVDGKPAPQKLCGMDLYGHEGVDYGSAGVINGYMPDLKLGVSFAMNTAGLFLPSACGMNCSLRYDILPRAPTIALYDLLNTVMEEISGTKPSCPDIGQTYTKLPAASCQDAPSLGRLNLVKKITCDNFPALTNSSTSQSCASFLSYVTLTALKGIYAKAHVWYLPPAGYDPDTTLLVDLCRGTCGAVGSGPCWLNGASQEWCAPMAEQSETSTLVMI